MDLSDLSHSYPFLHLSRKFGVPYSEVLKYADLVDNRIGGLCVSSDFERIIASVCHSSWRNDFSRAQERGL